MNKIQLAFWEKFKDNNRMEADICFGSAWSFGDSPEIASNLASLVLQGKKTATASSLLEYQLENEEVPTPLDNHYDMLLDGNNDPVAILKTTHTYIVPFYEVSEEHAYKEGEGDQTIYYWRKVHKLFWTRRFDELNVAIDIETMDVVCEEFEVFWKDV